MEEAYRFIDWKAVFLIAGMVPLGTALQTTGAARLVAEQLVAQVGAAGPMVLVIGLFALAATASLFLPNAVAALIIAPIALDAAIGLGVSPYSALLAVAVGSSNSFLTPVGHPANVLVMGPGGYRFTDYIRLGLPLLLVVLAALLLVLPLTWPL